MRRIFMVPDFAKWVRKKRIPESLLCGAIQECVDGLIDAEFGDVLKKRIPLHNQGKRGGARTIIAAKELLAARRGNRWFFLYGHQKNEAPDVTDADIEAFQRLATKYLRLSDLELAVLLSAADLKEVHCEKVSL